MNTVQRLTLGVGSFLILSIGSFAFAESTPRFDGRTFGIEVEGEYFTTDENLDSSGERSNLPYSNSFETFTTKAKFDYSLKRNWLIGGGGEFNYSASSTFDTTAIPNEQVDKTATELNSFNIFSQFQLQTGTFRIVPQAIGTFTVKRVDRASGDVLTGEGTNNVEVGSWAMVDVGLSEAYGYVGYRMQDDDRAHLLPWRVGDQFYIFRTIYTRVELGGYLPVKDDKYVNQRAYRTFVTNSVDGASFRYYSVNPNLIEARIEGGLNASPELEVYGGLTHTISGESVAYGLSAYVGVRYSANTRKSVSPYEKSNSDFSDDVNTSADDQETDEEADLAADRAERAKSTERRATRARTFRQQRRSQQFTPQLEDYNPAMFEKEMKKGKKAN